MPPRRDRDTTTWLDSWESFAEEKVREAIERGEFAKLPGAGRPVALGDENPFDGDLGPAYRLARNAGVAPGWVSVGQEVEECLAALEVLLQAAPQSVPAPSGPTDAVPVERYGFRAWLHRLWFGPAKTFSAPHVDQVKVGRSQARARYLERAAYTDARIQAFNAQLPRQLSWLERPRLTRASAEARFDRVWPPSGSVSKR